MKLLIPHYDLKLAYKPLIKILFYYEFYYNLTFKFITKFKIFIYICL